MPADKPKAEIAAAKAERARVAAEQAAVAVNELKEKEEAVRANTARLKALRLARDEAARASAAAEKPRPKKTTKRK